jgi:hypothetical protein
MRIYPKGCRYIRVCDGEIEPARKLTKRCKIEDLRGYYGKSTVWLIVLPRGRGRWMLFRCHWLESPRFMRVDRDADPDALAMAAALGGFDD